MGIEFPTGSDACDNYGYTFDSACTSDSGTLGYDQTFTNTVLPDGTNAWIPLVGVRNGLPGEIGPQGRTGPPRLPALGNQGYQGRQGAKGEDAPSTGTAGGIGDTGDLGVTFPAKGDGVDTPEISYRFSINFARQYTAKKLRSNDTLDYSGLEVVKPQTNRFAQFHLQPGRNDLQTIDVGSSHTYFSPFQFNNQGVIGGVSLTLPSWIGLEDFDEITPLPAFAVTNPTMLRITDSRYLAPNASFANNRFIFALYSQFVPDVFGPRDPNQKPIRDNYTRTETDSTIPNISSEYNSDEIFDVMHPIRHINADNAFSFSLYRRDNMPPTATSNRPFVFDDIFSGVAGAGNFGGLTWARDVAEVMERYKETVEISTTPGSDNGIDLRGITQIALTNDSPVMGRVIEFPYVDVFREFQGAVPGNTSGAGYDTTTKGDYPYGTLPIPGDPSLVILSSPEDVPNGYISDTGARSAIRDLNQGWEVEESGLNSANNKMGKYNHNPFNYAPLNLSTPEGTGPDANNWKTVFGGRMPYMFYWGGPCIAQDGNPEEGFSASARWQSTKGSDNKHGIYIQEKFNPTISGTTFQSPQGSSGPWPLRQSMHFNGFKYSNNGVTQIDKVVFLTGTPFASGNELALGTGGSVTLTFSQWNQDTDDGGPTYGFGHLFEFVAGTCADTDPKVSSTDDPDKVVFLGGVTHDMGTNIGDVDVFHIFCTGMASGTAGYLISHQQYR